MTTFAALLLAHLLSDFPLQTDRIFRMKLQGHKGLALHSAIHVLVTALLIANFWRYWHVLLLLGVLHYLTDWAKLRCSGKRLTPGFIVDQLVHLFTLILIVTIAPGMTAVLPLSFLIPALILALIPALLTFAYVCAIDQCQAQTQNSHLLQWACTQLLPLSQKTGWVIVVMLTTTGLLVRV